MERYIFTVNRDTMAAQSPPKGQADLNNIVGVALPRYGTVERVDDSIPQLDELEKAKGTIEELKTTVFKANAEIAFYEPYKPLIAVVEAMRAESLAVIEELTKRAKSAEMAVSELSEFAELIEAAKRLKE